MKSSERRHADVKELGEERLKLVSLFSAIALSFHAPELACEQYIDYDRLTGLHRTDPGQHK